jgi:hypothetical protein
MCEAVEPAEWLIHALCPSEVLTDIIDTHLKNHSKFIYQIKTVLDASVGDYFHVS